MLLTLPDDFIPLDRVSSPYLDSMLGYRHPLLDGKGFLAVIDYMGDDGSIVQAARTSYGKGTKRVSEDRGLIRYLFRHTHTTPVEMCELKLFVKCPMDLWRQWIRTRMASVNEHSTRYSDAIEDTAITSADAWRLQSGTNKQGSKGTLIAWPNDDKWNAYKDVVTPGEHLTQQEEDLQHLAKHIYQERLELGIAREQARKDLPLSTFTLAYWKIDLHNLFHFLALRMDAHAQLEIKLYATYIGEEIVAGWVPIAWEAFNDYHFRRAAMILTRLELAVITAIHREGSRIDDGAPFDAACTFGWMELVTKKKSEGFKEYEHPDCDGTGKIQVAAEGNVICKPCGGHGKVWKLKKNRERAECEVKLEALGLEIPWKEFRPVV